MPTRSETREDLQDLQEAITLFDDRGWAAGHPAYKAVQKELDALQKTLDGTVDIRTPEMIASHRAGDGLAFPAATRSEMADFLTGHTTRFADGRLSLSWNIKIRDYVEASDEEFDFDPAYDERWEQLLQKDGNIFFEACENALRHYMEGEYTAATDTRHLKAKFSTDGRSNGHLVLVRLEGFDRKGNRESYSAQVDSETDLRRWIEEEMDDEEVVALYRLVVSVDADVADRDRAVAYELGAIRARREEEWAEEVVAEDAPSM